MLSAWQRRHVLINSIVRDAHISRSRSLIAAATEFMAALRARRAATVINDVASNYFDPILRNPSSRLIHKLPVAVIYDRAGYHPSASEQSTFLAEKCYETGIEIDAITNVDFDADNERERFSTSFNPLQSN